jgi:hypothetical protein
VKTFIRFDTLKLLDVEYAVYVGYHDTLVAIDTLITIVGRSVMVTRGIPSNTDNSDVTGAIHTGDCRTL